MQVFPDGVWTLRTGHVGFDDDHRGVCAEDTIPTTRRGMPKRFDSRVMAAGLINGCADMAVDGGLNDDVTINYVFVFPKTK